MGSIGCATAGNMARGDAVKLDATRTSPDALAKLAAQPIYGTFCVATPVYTPPSTEPSFIGFTAPTGASTGSDCITEITGYSESSMASGMNLIPRPQDPGPNVDDLENRISKMVNDPGCAKFIRDLITVTSNR